MVKLTVVEVSAAKEATVSLEKLKHPSVVKLTSKLVAATQALLRIVTSTVPEILSLVQLTLEKSMSVTMRSGIGAV